MVSDHRGPCAMWAWTSWPHVFGLIPSLSVCTHTHTHTHTSLYSLGMRTASRGPFLWSMERGVLPREHRCKEPIRTSSRAVLLPWANFFTTLLHGALRGASLHPATWQASLCLRNHRTPTGYCSLSLSFVKIWILAKPSTVGTCKSRS